MLSFSGRRRIDKEIYSYSVRGNAEKTCQPYFSVSGNPRHYPTWEKASVDCSKETLISCGGGSKKMCLIPEGGFFRKVCKCCDLSGRVFKFTFTATVGITKIDDNLDISVFKNNQELKDSRVRISHWQNTALFNENLVASSSTSTFFERVRPGDTFYIAITRIDRVEIYIPPYDKDVILKDAILTMESV